MVGAAADDDDEFDIDIDAILFGAATLALAAVVTHPETHRARVASGGAMSNNSIEQPPRREWPSARRPGIPLPVDTGVAAGPSGAAGPLR